MHVNRSNLVAQQQRYGDLGTTRQPKRPKSPLNKLKARPSYHRSPLSNVTQPHDLTDTKDSPDTEPYTNPVARFFQFLLALFITACFTPEEEEALPFLQNNQPLPASTTRAQKQKVHSLPRDRPVESPILVATANKILSYKLEHGDGRKNGARELPWKLSLKISDRAERESIRKEYRESKSPRRISRPPNTRLWTDEWKAHSSVRRNGSEEMGVHAAAA